MRLTLPEKRIGDQVMLGKLIDELIQLLNGLIVAAELHQNPAALVLGPRRHVSLGIVPNHPGERLQRRLQAVEGGVGLADHVRRFRSERGLRVFLHHLPKKLQGLPVVAAFEVDGADLVPGPGGLLAVGEALRHTHKALACLERLSKLLPTSPGVVEG